jgi:hypothetical protein
MIVKFKVNKSHINSKLSWPNNGEAYSATWPNLWAFGEKSHYENYTANSAYARINCQLVYVNNGGYIVPESGYHNFTPDEL